MISAVVVLHSKSGKRASGNAVITAETLHEYEPDAKSVLLAQSHFNSLGFQVTPMLGISFSIIGTPSVFEKIFQVTLQRNERKGMEVIKPKRLADNELPLDKLPRKLKQLIYAITFTPQPDFGPENFYHSTP